MTTLRLSARITLDGLDYHLHEANVDVSLGLLLEVSLQLRSEFQGLALGLESFDFALVGDYAILLKILDFLSINEGVNLCGQEIVGETRLLHAANKRCLSLRML